jgi:hypothetical protein
MFSYEGSENLISTDVHELTPWNWEFFLRSRQTHNYSRISQYFKEPEGLLPCSQEPATSSYPEPDESSPYRHILFL